MSESDSIRVILCAPGFPASVDDSDKPFLLDHATALTRAGAQVTVICPMVNGLPSRHRIAGIEVLRVRYAPRRLQTIASSGSMYREARGLKSLLVLPMLVSLMVAMVRELRSKHSVAYGHWWVPGGLVAVIAATLTRRPSVVHLHGSDAAIAANGFLRVIASFVIRRASVCLAVSQELANWSAKVSGQTCEVLPMPIDLQRLPKPSPPPHGGLTLGVGRLVAEKGFDLLIEAASLIDRTARPEITIIGIGPERERLEAQARRLNVQLHLPGPVSPREIGDWYSRASIVIIPSRREGFGMVAAEASAAGRAVIATKVGAMPQMVEDGISGLLVEPENVGALHEALISVDPTWGSEGPSQVVELGMNVHGQRVRRVCEDLLN